MSGEDIKIEEYKPPYDRIQKPSKKANLRSKRRTQGNKRKVDANVSRRNRTKKSGLAKRRTGAFERRVKRIREERRRRRFGRRRIRNPLKKGRSRRRLTNSRRPERRLKNGRRLLQNRPLRPRRNNRIKSRRIGLLNRRNELTRRQRTIQLERFPRRMRFANKQRDYEYTGYEEYQRMPRRFKMNMYERENEYNYRRPRRIQEEYFPNQMQESQMPLSRGRNDYYNDHREYQRINNEMYDLSELINKKEKRIENLQSAKENIFFEEDDLRDEYIAATHLRDTYVGENWTRAQA